ncbi:MAG: hypothetical protein NXH91_03415 [Phyllobacteriaceae bacterium]|jgi:hypothetical protein|nr:hypothetical protein [Phyllobacteriaceae bacterium]
MVDLQDAIKYIKGLRLPDPPNIATGEAFDGQTDQPQGVVIGSELLTFDGLDANVREAVTNAFLLAQLHADATVGDKMQTHEYYSRFAEVLQGIGWLVHEETRAANSERGDSIDVHASLLSLAELALSPHKAAVDLVRAVLDVMMKADDNEPWITFYYENAVKSENAHLSIALAQSGTAIADVSVALVQLAVRASKKLSKRVIFRRETANATLDHITAKLGINEVSLMALNDEVASHIGAHSSGYIRNLPPLPRSS